MLNKECILYFPVSRLFHEIDLVVNELEALLYYGGEWPLVFHHILRYTCQTEYNVWYWSWGTHYG